MVHFSPATTTEKQLGGTEQARGRSGRPTTEKHQPEHTIENGANWTTTRTTESNGATSEDREEPAHRDRKSWVTATETETEVGVDTKPSNQGGTRPIKKDCYIQGGPRSTK